MSPYHSHSVIARDQRLLFLSVLQLLGRRWLGPSGPMSRSGSITWPCMCLEQFTFSSPSGCSWSTLWSTGPTLSCHAFSTGWYQSKPAIYSQVHTLYRAYKIRTHTLSLTPCRAKPPDETYSDINIFGLQTVYVIVSFQMYLFWLLLCRQGDVARSCA